MQRPTFFWPGIIWRLAHSTDGNVAVVFALMLPILIGATGLGVETSYWYYKSLQLQSAADAAAYAAELENMSGSTTSQIKAEASAIASKNGFEPAAGSIDVHSPPTSGAFQTVTASEVILHQDLARYFTAIFANEPVALSARAVAKSEIASMACILALDGSASRAALFSGNTRVDLTGCAVMSNSKAADALKVQGSAAVSVRCLISAGGADVGGATMTSCSKPILHAQAAADPFLDLTTPEVSGSCMSSKTATLQPGRYCSGLSLSGTKTLASGTYVVEGGDFKVNAKALVTGQGVTIYLTCNARVSINGTATVQLSAPTAGPYSGVLFFGDRNCAGGTNTFNGTANSKLTGAIYFAKQAVQYLGNFSGEGGCSQIVAGTVEWSGSTSIKQDCTSLGMRDIPANQLVSLVE